MLEAYVASVAYSVYWYISLLIIMIINMSFPTCGRNFGGFSDLFCMNPLLIMMILDMQFAQG